MKIVLPLVLSTLALARQSSFESLGGADQALIRAKLSKWKTLYGPIAEAHGFTPSQEKLNLESHTNEELERFHTTIQQVEEASKENPHATFSEFNKFALMTDDEFSAFLGVSFGNHTARASTGALPEIQMEAEVDWTTSKCMPPVKEQGNCGSCWAFSTLGTAEIAHCLATGELLDLSEQQVTSCDTTNKGCKGGYPPNAHDWITNGVCTEEAWPYTSGVLAQTGACNQKCTKKELTLGEVVLVSGEDALQNALNSQPVTVIVEAGNSVWKNYKGGVITKCPGWRSDHAVIAVGYGTSTADYFKIKNSWGPEWGENGYMYLQRGTKKDGMCNIGEEISYHKVAGSNPQPVKPTSAPSASPSTSAPKPSKSTPTPATTSVPATTSTLKPTTSSPSTSKPRPTKKTRRPKTTPQPAAPTTGAPTSQPSTNPTPSPPASQCGSCKGCYFPDVKWCVRADFAKNDCQNTDGAVWCGV